MSSTPTGCAVGPDGKLLDASEITFYHDVDDTMPIPASSGTSLPSKPSTLDTFFHTQTAGTSSARSPATITAAHRQWKVASDNKPDNSLIPTDAEDNCGDGQHLDSDSITAEAAYAQTKALGDTDRKAMKARPKDDHSSDICMIFTCNKESINPDNGEQEDRHWCNICKDKGFPHKDSFFTGSISTLHVHIRRNKDHYKCYKRICEEKNIPMHPRAIPNDNSGTILRQSTLDSAIIQSRIPPFSMSGLLDYIVELVVSEDKAMHLIDHPAFQNLLQFCHPSLAEQDIPHQTKLCKEIIERAKIVKLQVKQNLSDAPGQISFTFDSWTSNSGDPFLSVTGHYITAPPNSPYDWELQVNQLAFKYIEGNHSGTNIG